MALSQIYTEHRYTNPKENTYIDSRRLILDMDVHRIPNYTTKHKDIDIYNSRRFMLDMDRQEIETYEYRCLWHYCRQKLDIINLRKSMMSPEMFNQGIEVCSTTVLSDNMFRHVFVTLLIANRYSARS